MSQVTQPIILNSTGQAIAQRLQSIANALNGIPVLTRTEWDALTIAEKQAYNLVAIRKGQSAYPIVDLLYGPDSLQGGGQYIPYSTGTLLCEAYVDNFDGTSLTWGTGISPIQIDVGLEPSLNTQENAIYLGVKEKNKYAYVDLGSQKAPFTAYIVAKMINPATYTRIISSLAARSTGQGMLLFGSTINVSSWASDTSTGVNSSAAYFAAALQYNGTSSGAGIAGSTGSFITKTPSNSNQYLTIGRADIDSSTATTEPGNLYLRYLGVINESEPESVIRQNLAALESTFISS